jgi:hypothetical protein
MKITLDHNCLIDLATGTQTGLRISELLAKPASQPYIVNIGASEMREQGIRPDRYDLFEELLHAAGVYDAPRLDPALIWDVTFWDRCVWTGPDEAKLITEIETILFGDSVPVSPTSGLDSPEWKKWLNRVCDVQTLWCHIRNGNELFLTSDKNFIKQSKLQRLIALGAGSIQSPN